MRRFVLVTAPDSPYDRDWLAPEGPLVAALAAEARPDTTASAAIQCRAVAFVRGARANAANAGLGGALDRFLLEYGLDSEEGVLLMCLAEALLRIPDQHTADELIADKLAPGRWRQHLGEGDSLLINASTWGLMLTGRLLAPEAGRLATFMARMGEPLIRAALRQAMRILGEQFVAGRDIDAALAAATAPRSRRYLHSFDMLGEAALTRADAVRYLQGYHTAITRIATATLPDPARRPGISVKLSALHPRYEPAQRERVLAELLPVLLGLVESARVAGIPLTLDAEESERLGLSLELADAVLGSGLLRDYAGFGLAVQAYQKRAPAVLAWLAGRARDRGVRIAVRLVKGAYWDSEIKRAQERGLEGYPVYTRKAATDVAYLACARRLAADIDVIRPQFATHNAHTVAWVLHLLGERPADFEFQRLHGMGEALYSQLPERYACRVYAPVGAHRDLLPYLVRRLLENGANTSFVNRIVDRSIAPEEAVRDPFELAAGPQGADPRIVPPADLFQPERGNSAGLNLASTAVLREFEAACNGYRLEEPAAVREVDPAAASALHATAAAAFRGWDEQGGKARARILRQAAQLLEERRAALVACCVLEAGRTVPDALAEQREAVDLLRYYAARAREGFEDAGAGLAGVVGEENRLRLRGRGVFVCISPWNFPLSLFTGQVAAALAAGNAVIAKPAPQTPRCAALVTALLHAAGVPRHILQLAPGGAELGSALLRDPQLAGVAFTGSTATAARIAATLASRGGPLVPFIAETGGINAIVADSSALPEQLVQDVIASAFNSAGQRCSAARLLFVQRDIAPRVLELLGGAMDELVVGDVMSLATDVGPVIDPAAWQRLDAYRARLLAAAAADGRWRHQAPLAADAGPLAFAPLAVEIEASDIPAEEVFGPVLHVLRFAGDEVEAVIDRIDALGYGLTLGLHTRIQARAVALARRARVGNVYVNRNIIGAVVGSQPFGGVGLSGSGPKAGGPHYLQRFAWEQAVSTNTAAIGGNASLLAQRPHDEPTMS